MRTAQNKEEESEDAAEEYNFPKTYSTESLNISRIPRNANCTLPVSCSWPSVHPLHNQQQQQQRVYIHCIPAASVRPSVRHIQHRERFNSILILCIFMQFNVSCPTPPPPLPCQLQGRNGQDGADRPTAWKWKCTQHTFRNNNSKSQPLVSPTTGFYPPTSCTNNNTSTTSQETNDQVGFND